MTTKECTDNPPASEFEKGAFIAAPLTTVQRKEKQLLHELARSQWILSGAIQKSTAPHLLANAFIRGLLLSDPLWEEAISDAVWDFTEAKEQVVAQYNSMLENNDDSHS